MRIIKYRFHFHKMTSINATYFKGSERSGIVETHATREPPKGKEVLIKITHSGICGTDEHYKTADMVLGHEGVGKVLQVGDKVTRFKVGDHVGWGYIHKTCGTCHECITGEDQYCQNKEMYGTHNFHQGSFGTHAIWEETFLFSIPQGIAPEHAAPLMCGGATVFEAIEKYNIRPTERVGVVGVGGLGHLAIQFLRKMGAAVVVFSSTEGKRKEAMKLGATEFYATKGVTKFENVKLLDHLLVTTNFVLDWEPFFPIIRPKGGIFPFTVANKLEIPAMPIILRGIAIQGTVVSGRAVHEAMLEFAARNDVRPVVECFPMTRAGVEEGMTRLRDGKMRYRGVLVAQ
ncbi:unnamed protein product [Mycena citricolor]|uniref:Enoyl reductase (ER) domain-containing protein n=1 Tax=Mycena citricolor TaxID=2018698 RepID=A0AAD2JY53_9AGAR|nr:unnamed protein product [Mycena citricolor]